MTNGTCDWLGEWLIDGHEAVTRVNILGALDAFGAKVPIRAVQALVTHTVNELLAAITNSRVANVPSSIAQEICQGRQAGIRGCSFESMAGVMTVLVANMAFHAEIVVIASGACDELLLRQNFDAAIASACWFILDERWLREGSRNGLFNLRFCLRADTLGRAVHDRAILDEALDHPVTSARAMDTRIHARRAEIVVSMIANATMKVCVLHWLITVVAEYNPGAWGLGLFGTEGEICILCKIGEKALPCGERLRHGGFALSIHQVRRRWGYWVNILRLLFQFGHHLLVVGKAVRRWWDRRTYDDWGNLGYDWKGQGVCAQAVE